MPERWTRRTKPENSTVVAMSAEAMEKRKAINKNRGGKDLWISFTGGVGEFSRT